MAESVSGAKMGAGVLRSDFAGETCRLVPLNFEHTDAVIRWRNEPGIAKWFLTSHRFEAAGHEAWLSRARASDTDFNWAIEDSFGRPVGTVGVYHVDWSECTGEFGRLLIGEPSARGKGFAYEATGLALQAAREAGLSSIYLDVLSSNLPAYSLYTKIGFKLVRDNGNVRRLEFLNI